MGDLLYLCTIVQAVKLIHTLMILLVVGILISVTKLFYYSGAFCVLTNLIVAGLILGLTRIKSSYI